MNSNYPYCSIIVPVYNVENSIVELMRSLLGQEYPGKYEIIIVDNKSTDLTSQKLKSFNRVKVIKEYKIQSSYAARNRGLKNVGGRIIVFIDADCVAKKDWLKRGIGCLLKKKSDLVAGQVKFIFKGKKPNVYEYLDSARKMNQKSYVKRGFGATANLFVRKKVFDEIGTFRSDLESGGDYEFGIRATKAGFKIEYCGKAIVVHPARSTLSQLLKKTKRVGKGQAQLQKLGLLKDNKLNVINTFPILRVPKNRHYRYFSVRQTILMLITTNIVKYINLFNRIKYLWKTH